MKKLTNFDDATSISAKKWYEEYPKAEEPKKHGKSDMEVINLKAEAKKCLDSESTAYALKQSKSHNSDYSQQKTLLAKGTITDRVAAGILMVTDSPKHNLNQLSTLISQVKVAKHNQCGEIITNLTKMFLDYLLHPHYKLVKFEEQDLDQLDNYDKPFEADDSVNFNNRPTLSKNKLLACWYFEDQLKESYDRFISSLSKIADDTVDANRETAVKIINDLLMGNSEQEHKLLNYLVNKIGDPSSKVASKAVSCLTDKLLRKHPDMKIIVLKEVEKLLFRPNISSKAQYFAIFLLTTFRLTKEDTEVATTLIDVYLAFFKACLKKGEPDSRMMAAILTGVNKAYRFADISTIKLSDHIDSIYKVVHLATFNVSLNALSLLFQVVGKDTKLSDRFYIAFYKKLLDPQIGITNRREIFINLLFEVLCNDQSLLRLHAFLKRILQVSLNFPANMTCAILYTISQVLKKKKFSNKILTRSAATVKSDDTEIDLSNTLNEPIVKTKKKSKKEENTLVLSNVVMEPIKSVEKENGDVKPECVEIKYEFKATYYDPFNRNPLRSGANLSFYSELAALAKHFHPSVSLFASTIIQGKPIEYTGNPLGDLSLIRFLDRYVFKNPKKLDSKKVSKENDPFVQRAGYTPKGIRCLPVNSEAYLNERQDRIPVDELFLYQYLQKRREITGDEEDDIESVNSEDFNNMLDQLGKNKNINDLEDLDIAADFNTRPKKSKVNKNAEENDDELEDEDEEMSEDLEDSDIELDEFNEDDDVDLEDLDDIDDDLSDMEFNDDDDENNEIDVGKALKKRTLKKNDGNKNKKIKFSNENPFVSAEEFAEMLESQGRSKFKHGASKSFSDRDGASAKQLDWESERNQRIGGFRNSKKAKKPFKNFNNKKNFSKQKPIKRKK